MTASRIDLCPQHRADRDTWVCIPAEVARAIANGGSPLPQLIQIGSPDVAAREAGRIRADRIYGTIRSQVELIEGFCREGRGCGGEGITRTDGP